MSRFTVLLSLLTLVACQPGLPAVDAGLPDAGEPPVPDAGHEPPPLSWRKVGEAPPTRSNHVSFYWPPAQRTLVFSGNHVTGPIHDAWSWDGASWQPRTLEAAEYPERKNAGLALDSAGGRAFVFGGTWSGYPVAGGAHVVRVLGDTQRWDGASWTTVATASSPVARGGHAMAYDPVHGEAVIFGGSDNNTPFDDTWTFDGTAWSQRAIGAPHPSARINVRMAFDEQRQRLVLFGGQGVAANGSAVNLNDTWEWDGASWADVTGTAPAPEGRGHHAMHYDPLRQRVMLTGGARHFSPLPAGSALDDQWDFDGTRWARVEPAGAKPPPRCAASLAFDTRRNVMVLYGGFDAYDLADVWEWNGERWTERSTLPVPRTDFAFAQAGPAGTAVLFGGYLTGGQQYLADTSRYENGAWVRVTGAAPPARSSAALAMHGDDAVLLGGRSATNLLADMWTLKKGEHDWQKVTVPLPPARRYAAMAFDPARGVTLLFGGRGPSDTLGDTWQWDGAAWTQLQPEASPPARSLAALRFDPVRRQLVLLGGVDAARQALTDAWAFDGTAWSPVSGLSAAPSGRTHSATAFDAFGRLLSWGGREGDTVLGDSSVFERGEWVQVPGGPSPRFDAAWLDLGGRFVTVFGARTDFSTYWEDSADVWELGPASP